MNMNDAFLGSLIFNKNSGGAGGGIQEIDLTPTVTLGWEVRSKAYKKDGLCFIDIITGTGTGGFAEYGAIFSGAPLPATGNSVSLIGICNNSFYRFYVDEETGKIHSRQQIDAEFKEVVIFGSYLCE